MNNLNIDRRNCTSSEKTGSASTEKPSGPDILPFESWEKLERETNLAFEAFCVYRDFGPGRNIKKALMSVESNIAKVNKKYKTWRAWSAQFYWNRRAADYDKYLDGLRLGERRKTIEEREAAHKQITEKMLYVINKKLDCMNPDDLSQSNVTEWVKTAIHTEREILGVTCEENREKGQDKQLEIRFDDDFQGM